jgi:protein-S-isoprenylcysteine O-methyltransferase Ste14
LILRATGPCCEHAYIVVLPTRKSEEPKFFERTVRIQTDRGHTVVDTGPYAIVRHPGYVAACLVCVGMSLSLGSVWALIPASLSCGVLMVRTVWEDRTLQEELTGYKEYTQRVRYKLVPGVW